MSRFEIPAAPVVPPHQRGQGTVRLRFEDLSQDGRFLLPSIPTALAEACWASVFKTPWTREALNQGLVPILAHAVLWGDPGPFAVNADHSADGCWALGHTVDAAGAVNRLLMNMWVDLHGPRGLTYGDPPPGAGERLRAGRMYAEHVLTRPFAEAEERKVLRIDVPGLEAVPSLRFPWTTPESLTAIPAEAEPLDADWFIEPAPYVFGLVHTDVNQHVNSLVYPKVFEAAALRRVHAHGLSAAILSRRAEMSFRKPTFGGEVLRIGVRVYRQGDTLGAVGIFFDDASGPKKPRTCIAMEFEP